SRSSPSFTNARSAPLACRCTSHRWGSRHWGQSRTCIARRPRTIPWPRWAIMRKTSPTSATAWRRSAYSRDASSWKDRCSTARAGHPLNSLLVETSVELGRNAVFGRAEYVRRTAADLALVGSVSRELNIGDVSAGYARELCGRGVSCALGVLGTLYLVPAEL